MEHFTSKIHRTPPKKSPKPDKNQSEDLERDLTKNSWRKQMHHAFYDATPVDWLPAQYHYTLEHLRHP